jgi:glycosyltransferase involved in cell wall biosynthesis
MKPDKPSLSVIMPVYNRAAYLKQSIESVLNQSFRDFEFIIIDDGSNDGSVDIIQSFKDERIRFYRNSENRGIVYSRNRGLAKAQGKYVAMFDSDDIALADKFEKQIHFLEQNPEYVMCGTWVKWVDENGEPTGEKWKLPAAPKEIPAIMLFRNYFVQPTVVIRRDAIPEGGYSEGFDIVEDSKMWFDVSLKHKMANIPEYLLYYRVHSGNVSNRSEKHIRNSKKLIAYQLAKLNIQASEQELDMHLKLKDSDKISSRQELDTYEKWLLKIIQANEIVHLYNEKIFRRIVFNRWLKVCHKARALHIFMIYKFIKSPVSRLWI